MAAELDLSPATFWQRPPEHGSSWEAEKNLLADNCCQSLSGKLKPVQYLYGSH